MKVFLNATNDVLYRTKDDAKALATVQALDVLVTQEVINAPILGLNCSAGNVECPTFSRKTSGDGTDLSHYTEIVNPTYIDEYAIYDLVTDPLLLLNQKDSPKRIDYKIGLSARLHQKFTFNKGQLEKVEYYQNYDPGTKVYTDIVLEVDMAYTYVNDLPEKRDTTRSWYYKNGNKSPDTKVTSKYYTAIEPVSVNRRRRENLLDVMGITLIGYLYYFAVTPTTMTVAEALQAATDLLEWHKVVVDDFKRSGNKQIITDITNNVETQFGWLDDTITPLSKTFRDYITEEMTL